MINEQFIVSVRLMTYNQEEFIREAMDGIMMQKTKFPVEVVVGDDFSTDSTLNIIHSYEDTENINIKILDRKVGGPYWEEREEFRNNSELYGRCYNFTNILENCTGKYVALLDGDDYWTDPLKLQKQVDFLENNSDYVLCFHDCQLWKEGELITDYLTKTINKERFSTEDLSDGNFIHTPSVVFRNNKDAIPVQILHRSPVADYVLYLYLSLYGKIFKINQNMAVYRVHQDGIWSQFERRKKIKRRLKVKELLLENFPHASTKEIKLKYLKLSAIETIKNLAKGNFREAYYYVKKICINLYR